MKKIACFQLVFFLFVLMCQAQTGDYMQKYNESKARTQWFRDARFGMFIHWGAYAVPARGEWVKSDEKITTEEYQRYVNAFKPSNYHPEEWAKLAKGAGMKYAVMTAKHHDGFCLFDSKYTDYKVATNLPGRDFTREFVEAFRKEGLKVGLYYSLIDWHHSDYPNVGNHPMRENKDYGKRKFNWDNYLTYMHNQIQELMTNYGKIDVLWLDYSFDDYEGKKWKAKELIAMIKKYQPDIIINNRLVINHGVSSEGRKFEGYGDFETPEQGVPKSQLVDIYGNELTWETCLTLNNAWGFNSSDVAWKSPGQIINALVECVSKNGNLLLNIGPDAQGTVPEQSIAVLNEVGKWTKQNGNSIYGCADASYPKPDWGYYTKKGNQLYAHWTVPKIGHIDLGSIGEKVKTVTVLNTGKPAATDTAWWGNHEKGAFFVNIASPTYLTYHLPDLNDTVFEIELKD